MGSPAPPPEPDNANAAEDTALRILRGAGQSSASLQRNLERRGYTSDAAGEAVRRCSEAGYINDAALATSVAARNRRSGHGRARVAADLKARGVASDVIIEALDGQIDTEEAAALAVARQLWSRAGSPDGRDQKARMRVAGALQRRGFSSALVMRVMRGLE
jgi:regulatory protein